MAKKDETGLNWARLPPEFRIQVTGYLKLQERLPLQICSKREFETVSKCPIKLQDIGIGPVNNEFKRRLMFLKFSIPGSHKDRKVHQNRTLSVEKTVEEFLSVFKSRKSSVGTVTFSDGEGLGKFINDLVETIKDREELGQTTLLRVKKINWYGTILSHQIRFMDLLPYFDSDFLDVIKIEAYETSRIAMDMFLSSKQFKKAKSVSIFPFTKIPIEHFLHLDTVEIQQKKVAVMDAAKMIRNFITKPIPDMNYFTLMTDTGMKECCKKELFDQLGLPLHTRGSISCSSDDHILKFYCHNPKSRFLLKIDETSVFGVIASVEFIDNLKWDVSVFMNLMEFGFDWTSS